MSVVICLLSAGVGMVAVQGLSLTVQDGETKCILVAAKAGDQISGNFEVRVPRSRVFYTASYAYDGSTILSLLLLLSVFILLYLFAASLRVLSVLLSTACSTQHGSQGVCAG